MPVVVIVAGVPVTLIGAVVPFAWRPRFYTERRKRQRARAKGR